MQIESNREVDFNLVELFMMNIPDWTWDVVKQQLVTEMVDMMTTNILEQLTGDPTNDDRACEILDTYYKPDERNKDIIVDAFKILGADQTAYILDSLQLDKIKQHD